MRPNRPPLGVNDRNVIGGMGNNAALVGSGIGSVQAEQEGMAVGSGIFTPLRSF
jgi:hypothetical protein